MANKPPTITSAEFTGGPYVSGSGALMTIEVVASSLNTSTTPYAVPVVVGDTVDANMTSSATATGALEAFNELAAAISDDPTGRVWTVAEVTFDAATGAWTGTLTAEA